MCLLAGKIAQALGPWTSLISVGVGPGLIIGPICHLVMEESIVLQDDKVLELELIMMILPNTELSEMVIVQF